jgi:hypothetical protein
MPGVNLLKDWMRLTEAAEYLSAVLKDKLEPKDLLQFAFDGQLRLSVNFLLTQAYGNQAVICRRPPKKNQGQVYELRSRRYVHVTPHTVSLDGIFDLPMIGGEATNIKQGYLKQTGVSSPLISQPEGVYVQSLEGIFYQLQDCLVDAKEDKSSEQTGETDLPSPSDQGENVILTAEAESDEDKVWNNVAMFRRGDVEKYRPSATLPRGSMVVVRKDNLVEFARNCKAESSNPTAIPDLERTSLLKMVYGMAVTAYNYRAKANRNRATGENLGSIHADLDRLGLNLDVDTIRKYVKEAEVRFTEQE